MNQFSKRHYEIVAKALADAKSLIHKLNDPFDEQMNMLTGIGMVELMLCQQFYADNNKFDRPMFIRACDQGLTQGETNEPASPALPV